jgi:hypothetical protein
MQISESRVAKKTVEKKKGRKDVKYLGNVANGVNILLANRIGDQERQATCL